ncbi:portal protein [Cronobacter phage vB_CsaP_Ss1]|nr:portal protein [Cronobacter phage vB_CsaP_Ss1]
MEKQEDGRLSDEEILAIVSSELSSSSGASENDAIQAGRQKALAAYLGDKGSVVEGRSSVVSTDVADAIEWIMPEVMKAFTQNNEVVTFDPVGPDDRRQAQIESRYVYDILMKDNEGFIALHEFFKDALLQKNGFFKVWYEDEPCVTVENYTGLNQLEFETLQMDPELEITGLTEEQFTDEHGSMIIYNVNCKRTRKNGKIKIECIAPDDMRINRMHNSVCLKNARFIAQAMTMTKSDLIEAGFDKEIVDALPTESEEFRESKNYRFSMQGENIAPYGGNSKDPSQYTYDVSECYMRMDLDGDGIAERVKITVAGFDNPTHILDIEEVEEWPFISATAILMSHKLFGLSVYDRLKEIQEQKTAIWRNILDNMYLKNNQRTIAVEGMVNLDDLLVSRPGGIIRAKRTDAVAPYVTPDLGSDVYRMVDYLDQVRAGRVGVSPEGSIADQSIGDAVGSEGVERLLTQKEELVGLMVRVFAETGIKPLMQMIRKLLMKHIDATVDYEYHDEWVQVAPKNWFQRNRTTVRVGTGSGNRQQQASALTAVLGYQEKLLANPGQALVTEANVFTALDDLAKVSGMPGAGAYFLDPDSPAGKENKQRVDANMQQQQQKELQEAQMLAQTNAKIAEAEQGKAQAALANVKLTAENKQLQMQLDAIKNSSDNEIKQLQQQLAEAQALSNANHKDKELEFRYYDSDQRAAIERERIAMQGQKQTKQNTGE